MPNVETLPVIRRRAIDQWAATLNAWRTRDQRRVPRAWAFFYAIGHAHRRRHAKLR
jgi:hypothetical protein